MRKYGIGEIKLLIQNFGVNISDCIQSVLINKYNVPHLSYNKVFFYLIDNENYKYPVYTYVTNNKNAYKLYFENNNFYLNNGFCNIQVEFTRKISVYNCVINNKKVSEIVCVEANEHLAITLNHFCNHFKNNMQCKFCSINSWSDNSKSTIEEKIKAVDLLLSYGEAKHLSVTTGTLNSSDKGLKNIIAFCSKIRSKWSDIPIAVEFEPIEDLNLINELKNVGVSTVSCNIELLQENVRKFLMPGKGGVEKKLYFKNWKYAVNIFDKNQVYTNILLNKFEYLTGQMYESIEEITKIGVIPSIGLLMPEKGTELEFIELPNIEFQFKIHSMNIALLLKNELDPRMAKAGCPRNGSYSPINEFYTDLKYPQRSIIANYDIPS